MDYSALPQPITAHTYPSGKVETWYSNLAVAQAALEAIPMEARGCYTAYEPLVTSPGIVCRVTVLPGTAFWQDDVQEVRCLAHPPEEREQP